MTTSTEMLALSIYTDLPPGYRGEWPSTFIQIDGLHELPNGAVKVRVDINEDTDRETVICLLRETLEWLERDSSVFTR
jgi:hypothetical protein